MKKKTKIFSKKFWVEQNFFKLFTLPEHIVVWLSLAITVGIFIYNVILHPAKQSTYLSFVGSVLNIFAAASIIKKKSIFPLIALVASLVLVPLAWIERTYAIMYMYEVNVITMTVSLITWLRHSDKHANIKPRSVKWWQSLIYCIILAGLIALFTWVESLQSYQDWMSGKPHAEIPPLHFLIFDSASLMITVGEIIPLILRLKNIFPMYIAGNVVQIATWISKLVISPVNLNAWMMLINTFVFLAMNILGIINWNKENERYDR